MRIRSEILTRAFVAGLACIAGRVPAYAQSPVPAPTPMASHTVFIVLIVGAFLAWALSFSLATRRDSGSARAQQALEASRDAILDQLAAAESERQSGALSQERFARKNRQLRGKLGAVLGQLESQRGKGRKTP